MIELKILEDLGLTIKKALPEIKALYRDSIPQNFKTPSAFLQKLTDSVAYDLGDYTRHRDVYVLTYFPEDELNPSKELEGINERFKFYLTRLDEHKIKLINKETSYIDGTIQLKFILLYRVKKEVEEAELKNLHIDLRSEAVE